MPWSYDLRRVPLLYSTVRVRLLPIDKRIVDYGTSLTVLYLVLHVVPYYEYEYSSSYVGNVLYSYTVQYIYIALT